MDYCYEHYRKYIVICKQTTFNKQCYLTYNKQWDDCMAIATQIGNKKIIINTK